MGLSAGGSGKFVSKKIRKVRWRPRQDSGHQAASGVFATGSWDEETNEVAIWRLPERELGSGNPVLLSTHLHPGDVTGLVWLDQDLLAASSSRGGVKLLKLEHQRLLQAGPQAWPHVGALTCLAAHGEALAAASQEGRIIILSTRQTAPTRVYEKGDSCSITDILFSRSSEIVSSNMRGQLKLFDLRSNQQEAASTLQLSSDQSAIHSLARHPAQGHILISGGEDGYMAVWDLRKGRIPLTLLSAHQAPISEVKFHPDLPDHIFTCSQGGELLHWNGASFKSAATAAVGVDTATTASPWLASQTLKHKVETNSLISRQPLPINTLDVQGHSLVFGGDNEAFYVLNNIII